MNEKGSAGFIDAINHQPRRPGPGGRRQALLRRRSKATAQDLEGRNPLHHACSKVGARPPAMHCCSARLPPNAGTDQSRCFLFPLGTPRQSPAACHPRDPPAWRGAGVQGKEGGASSRETLRSQHRITHVQTMIRCATRWNPSRGRGNPRHPRLPGHPAKSQHRRSHRPAPPPPPLSPPRARWQGRANAARTLAGEGGLRGLPPVDLGDARRLPPGIPALTSPL